MCIFFTSSPICSCTSFDAQNLSDVTVSKALIGQIFPQNGVFTFAENDVSQVVFVLAIFCRFKPKKVCIFCIILEFLIVSKIILVKCCKYSQCPSRVFKHFKVFKLEYFYV